MARKIFQSRSVEIASQVPAHPGSVISQRKRGRSSIVGHEVVKLRGRKAVAFLKFGITHQPRNFGQDQRRNQEFEHSQADTQAFSEFEALSWQAQAPSGQIASIWSSSGREALSFLTGRPSWYTFSVV